MAYDPEAIAFADLHHVRMSPAVQEALGKFRLPQAGIDPMAIAAADLQDLRGGGTVPEANPNQGIAHVSLVARPPRGAVPPQFRNE